ncbi:MAG: hypothetical protein PHV32_00780 [Eubacteriales bacterium]|nr:hypothetical protein [Eubacteriales bacterium]
MNNKMTQPKIRLYYDWLNRNNFGSMELPSYDEESCKLLDELFLLIEQIKPISANGTRSLWFRAERGAIDDFGDLDELIAEGEVESEEEFVKLWMDYFPNEIEWYEFSAVNLKEETFRAIALRHRHVIVQDQRRPISGFPYEITEFVQWMVDSLKKCIAMLEAGSYNDFVRENLPPKHRIGTITRKALWDVWTESRASFFKDISKGDVIEFCKLAYQQPEDWNNFHERFDTMTADYFYKFCAMGYAANKYDGCDKSPKDQYYLHADGRDDGISKIDPDSPEAFDDWMTNRECHGGHPWEVCRGGNSTHVSLYVGKDKDGYYLTLAGDAWNRTIETVKFYLVLRRAGIPVYLEEAKLLADRLMEKEKLGIVPDGVMPAYCESLFPNEHIIDFLNLPEEDIEELLPFCEWQDIKPVDLVKRND